jgi:hypothetical protein
MKRMIRIILILFFGINMLMYLPVIIASSFPFPNFNSQNSTSYAVSGCREWTYFYQQKYTVDADSLTKRLKPIRANFKRINAIKRWTSIVSKDLEETLEGGEAKYYYNKDKLEKILSRNYGETYQVITEYYLLKGKLSFVYEKQLIYNRPMYYDSIAMVESKDTEFFDLKKSTVIEVRSYFERDILFHVINNPIKKSLRPKEYMMEEQSRIYNNYNKLLDLLK